MPDTTGLNRITVVSGLSICAYMNELITDQGAIGPTLASALGRKMVQVAIDGNNRVNCQVESGAEAASAPYNGKFDHRQKIPAVCSFVFLLQRTLNFICNAFVLPLESYQTKTKIEGTLIVCSPHLQKCTEVKHDCPMP